MGNNEWLEYNLKPLLNSVIALLQSITSQGGGNVLVEGSATNIPVSTKSTVVSYTNAETVPVYITGVVGTGNKTGTWTIDMPDGVSTRTLTKRTSFNAPNFVHSFVPGFKLAVGESITVSVEQTDSATNSFTGFILGYKTS